MSRRRATAAAVVEPEDTPAVEVPARRFVLSGPQWAAWTATERYLNLEGAYRSGKTTLALLKIGDYCWHHPGIHCLIARWTEDATFSQLKPAFLELLGGHVLEWRADESCFLIRSKDEDKPSRVYVRGLKPSEGTSPFSKIHGLTLAVGYIDQPEEMPEPYFLHLQTRLSQPGFPQQLILTPNPPSWSHWLDRAFPVDDSRRGEGYRYIRITMRDNVGGLGLDYIEGRERDLASKPAEYRRALLGERGLPMSGDPVYGGVFLRARHVVSGDLFDPALPLVESWDFGHVHPAVVWLQFPPGELRILGGVMGSDLFLESFVPLVEDLRAEWFPGLLNRRMTQWTCDPAGEARNPHGGRAAVDILRGFGIVPRTTPDANDPARRDFAIQTVSGYLSRSWPDGRPTCAVSDRFLLVDAAGQREARPVLVDGLEVGYTWAERAYAAARLVNIRRAAKDGFFEHPFNALEYGVLTWAPVNPAEVVGYMRTPEAESRARRLLGVGDGEDIQHRGAEIVALNAAELRRRAELRALQEAQRDTDEDDSRLGLRGSRRPWRRPRESAYLGKGGGRGGW